MERDALDEGIDRFNQVLVTTGRAARAVDDLEAADARGRIPKGVRNEHWQEIDRHYTAEEDAAELAKLKRLPGGRAVVEAIVSTRALREAIDAARAHLPALASLVNNSMHPPIEHWTTLADGELRELRGALVLGQPKNVQPSCLPWVGQGVVAALEEAYRPITRRFERLKSLRFTLEDMRAAGLVPDGTAGRQSADRRDDRAPGSSAGVGTGAGPRDEGLAWEDTLRAVHRAVAGDPAGFAEAVGWLGRDYSAANVRRRRAAAEAGDLDQPASAHQLGGLTPGSDSRLWRLSAAYVDLRTNPPDLSLTALGPQARDARRLLLVVTLLTDRTIGECDELGLDLAFLSFGERWSVVDDELRSGQGIWPALVHRALRLVAPPEGGAPVSAEREGARGSTEKQAVTGADQLADLEATTPPLDRGNGKWVDNKTAAGLDGVKTGTLATYRAKGIKNAAESLGRDCFGRVWRRSGTDDAHPWYLKSTLRNSAKAATAPKRS